jgi:CheY-like chemotaxis protein
MTARCVDAPRRHDVPIADGPTVTLASTTVLYIDDDRANVMLVERVLLARRPHLTLLVAGTGAAGIALASEHLPSLVLLDLFLPDVHGEAVLRALRRDDRTSALRVVVLSGASVSDQRDRLRGAGADDVLAKPFEIEDLLAVVDGTPRPPNDPSPTLRTTRGPVDPDRLHHLRQIYPEAESWRSFLDAFVEDCHHGLAVLARSARDGDTAAVAHSAHTLAGSWAMVSDGDALSMLLSIQSAVRCGHVPGELQLTALEQAFRVIEHALRSACGD